MSLASPVTPSDLPDAQDVKACTPIYEAIIILGRLYSDVAAIAQVERPDLYELAALAARVGREGMQASRRLKKAAEAGRS